MALNDQSPLERKQMLEREKEVADRVKRLYKKCTCGDKVIIPGENTPKGSLHITGCPALNPYMFYYEESCNAWCPVYSGLLEGYLDVLDPGEEMEIKIKCVDMSEIEFGALPDGD